MHKKRAAKSVLRIVKINTYQGMYDKSINNYFSKKTMFNIDVLYFAAVKQFVYHPFRWTYQSLRTLSL